MCERSRASSSPRWVGFPPTTTAPTERRPAQPEDVLGNVVEQGGHVERPGAPQQSEQGGPFGPVPGRPRRGSRCGRRRPGRTVVARRGHGPAFDVEARIGSGHRANRYGLWRAGCGPVGAGTQAQIWNTLQFLECPCYDWHERSTRGTRGARPWSSDVSERLSSGARCPRHRRCEHRMLGARSSTSIRPTSATGSTPGSASTTASPSTRHLSAPRSSWATWRRRPTGSTSGTGITSLTPREEHPVRCAERAAMHRPPHSEGRFEWGTGRGAGSHELAAFNIVDKNSTKAEWNEVVRRDPRGCGRSGLQLRGQVLHRAVSPQRPAQAVRQGSPADLGRLWQPGHVHPGRQRWASVPSPSTSSRSTARGRIAAYKEGVAACADPIGGVQERQRHAHQRGCICLSDRDGRPRRRPFASTGATSTRGLPVPRHHPKPDCAPTWPESVPPPDDEAAVGPADRGGVAAVRRSRRGRRAWPGTTRSAATRSASGSPAIPRTRARCSRCSRSSAARCIPQFDKDRCPLDHASSAERVEVPRVHRADARHQGRGAPDQRDDPAGRDPEALVAQPPGPESGRRSQAPIPRRRGQRRDEREGVVRGRSGVAGRDAPRPRPEAPPPGSRG